jgi:hypothetical protein
MEFTAGVNSNNWVANSGSYSLTLPLPGTLPNGLDYDVVVYKKRPNDKAEKMYPTIDISPTYITIHSENPYMGYALITKRGTYVGAGIADEINQAANNANTATTRADNIAQTLETAYEDGTFNGYSIYATKNNATIKENPVMNEIFTLTSADTIVNVFANRNVKRGDIIIDGVSLREALGI